ncbi:MULTISPECIES: hypothetical protein [Pelosinus]|uniref:hypothetical protein n=1 Tax=Pelosinus TaxID=365348 RepID=UPI0002DF0FC3|nr:MULTISPECIES: hypothetical protein [Pelosinus]
MTYHWNGYRYKNSSNNIVIGDVSPFGITAKQAAASLGEQGIKVAVFGEYSIRFVTHHGIEKDDISHTASVIARIFKGI